MRKFLFSYLTLAMFSLSFLSSCGGGTTEPSLADRLQGTWVLGTVTGAESSFIGSFTITFNGNSVNLNINGTVVSGTFTVNGDTVTTQANFNGETVTLTAVVVGSGELSLTFTTGLKRTSAKPADTFNFNLDKQP